MHTGTGVEEAVPATMPRPEEKISKKEISWPVLLGPEVLQSKYDLPACTAVVHACLWGLGEEESVLRIAAQTALKSLIAHVILWVAAEKEEKEKKCGNSRKLEGGATSDNNVSAVNEKSMWLALPETIIIPGLRRGLKQSSDAGKKVYISLLKYVVTTLGVQYAPSDAAGKTAGNYSSVAIFHGDLRFLVHEDPEQDFFENISHIQFHRRTKAMARLRRLLQRSNDNDASNNSPITTGSIYANSQVLAELELVEEVEENNQDSSESTQISTHGAQKIGSASLVHVLLPLAYHHIFSAEFVKKDHQLLMQEASLLVGAISRHLGWSAYHRVLKHVMRQFSRLGEEKEKTLLLALCTLLDNFHFDMGGVEEAEGDGVEDNAEEEEYNEEQDAKEWKATKKNVTAQAESAPVSIPRTVHESILPWLESFLLKSEKNKKGQTMKVVRSSIALAMTKLIKRLEPPAVSMNEKNSLFTSLIIKVCGTLRSRDSTHRDIARDSLANMVRTMGMQSLRDVLYELQHQLTEGFQRHICNYTVRSVLASVLEGYCPPPCRPPPTYVRS